MRLRHLLRSNRHSSNRAARSVVRTVDAAHRLASFVVNGEYRSVVIAKITAHDQLHQTTTLTWPDRYPGIFAACRAHLADRDDLRILSFGCSTGEEVATLRRYFPDATITGAEINRRSLRTCRRRVVDPRIGFVYSEREAIARHAPFHAIFCMAVLQRTPQAVESAGIMNLSSIYPFQRFEQQLRDFDAWLEPNGLLVIHHAQYRVSDTSVAGRYQRLEGAGQELDRGPVFDRSGDRLGGADARQYGSIFVKRASDDWPIAERDGVQRDAGSAAPPNQLRHEHRRGR